MNEYMLIVIIDSILLFMTSIFALHGFDVSLPQGLSLLQEHLIISIIIYIILFGVSCVLSYKRYFRYRNPPVVYKKIKCVRDFLAMREIDGIFGANNNLKSKNKDVEIALGNLKNGSFMEKKLALIQLREFLRDSDQENKISIVKELFNSIYYQDDEAFRLLIFREICKFIKNKDDKQVLLSMAA